MAEANPYQEGRSIDYTPVAAVGAGEVVQLADGRAAVATTAIAAGVKGSVAVRGVWKIAKTDLQFMFPGERIYWDHSANAATVIPSVSDEDFFVGTCLEAAAGGDATVTVVLNEDRPGIIDQRTSGGASLPIGALARAANLGGGMRFEIAATSEAEKVDWISDQSIGIDSDWTMFADVNNDAVAGADVDFNIGLGDVTAATDFESVGTFVAVHLDGGSLNILAHSDDTNTDAALTDTTFDYVVATKFHIAIVGTNPLLCEIYINGILNGGATDFVLDSAESAARLKAIVHAEKTTGTHVGTYTVSNLKVVTADL
jgi:predicted RecA/RadA family phage recombinase